MDIKRCDAVADVEGGAILEVREAAPGAYLVILIEDAEPLLYGSFSSSELAEAQGVQVARHRGHLLLHVVHSQAT